MWLMVWCVCCATAWLLQCMCVQVVCSSRALVALHQTVLDMDSQGGIHVCCDTRVRGWCGCQLVWVRVWVPE